MIAMYKDRKGIRFFKGIDSHTHSSTVGRSRQANNAYEILIVPVYYYHY